MSHRCAHQLVLSFFLSRSSVIIQNGNSKVLKKHFLNIEHSYDLYLKVSLISFLIYFSFAVRL